MLRLFDLMTITGNIRGSVWPNLRVISNFFDFLQMFEVKMRPKNGEKSTFQILKAHITKTVEVMAKTI